MSEIQIAILRPNKSKRGKLEGYEIVYFQQQSGSGEELCGIYDNVIYSCDPISPKCLVEQLKVSRISDIENQIMKLRREITMIHEAVDRFNLKISDGHGGWISDMNNTKEKKVNE